MYNVPKFSPVSLQFYSFTLRLCLYVTWLNYHDAMLMMRILILMAVVKVKATCFHTKCKVFAILLLYQTKKILGIYIYAYKMTYQLIQKRSRLHNKMEKSSTVFCKNFLHTKPSKHKRHKERKTVNLFSLAKQNTWLLITSDSDYEGKSDEKK